MGKKILIAFPFDFTCQLLVKDLITGGGKYIFVYWSTHQLCLTLH